MQYKILAPTLVHRHRTHLWFWITCLLLISPLLVKAEAVTDVRVLIDVSGSMKKNDPQNLRAPAVKMLVGLLPENTKSGIWTFGRYVNMQVKHGTVNEAWKKQAMVEADKIHSRGLFTNIEEAIQRSTSDWTKPDPRYKRHLILLTDGMVDIGKDERLNEQSRRRLLHDILPRVEAADATIHSIALSKNADADLLHALSGATRGSHQQVDSAKQLQRIFLKLFEKSVKPDTVPIEDNKFSVDKHVSDITVLIFLAKDSPATQLTTPGGKTWSAKTHPDNVNWHHDPGYDLITAKGPAAGEWKLQAKVDPDNRVMIVSNLRLKVDKLPNTIMLGDHFDVRARLLEEGKTVTHKNLLAKTRFEVKQADQGSHVEKLLLVDTGSAPDIIKGDGVYTATADQIKEAGEYELSIRAKSLTFVRATQHTLQVYDSPANITITQDDAHKPFHVVIKPHSGLIRPESVSMQVTLPDSETLITTQDSDQTWAVDIPNKYANKTFTLTLAGTRYSDESIKMDFEKLLSVTGKSQSLALKVKAKPAAKGHFEEKHDAEKSEEDEKAEDGHDNKAEDSSGEEHADEEKGGFNWLVVVAMIIGANGIVIGGGWFAYRTWKKRQKKDEAAVEEALKDE